MRLTRVSGPAADPVSLAEAKDHERISHTSEDSLVETYLAAAIARFDGRDGILGRCLISQTWELALDAFPAGEIAVPLPPLQSIDSITYVAPDGTATLAAEAYRVAGIGARGRIAPVDAWPSTDPRPEAVTVTFTAGYGDTAADVPWPIRRGILEVFGDMYRYRETMTDAQVYSLPRSAMALVAPFRERAF